MFQLILYLVFVSSIITVKSDEDLNIDLNNEINLDLTSSPSEKHYWKYLLNKQESDLNFTELALKHGYKSVEYTVETEDGYLLTMFRIIKSRKCYEKRKGPPVIIQHGLLASSDCFIQAGPDIALGYLLADACYDVWFPNQRGNSYGRRHLNLSPDKKEFWEFSVDEIGLYDIPAMIDAVLYNTGAKKVNYIGHSQGCGTFYIMCSERPEYCRDKVNLKISLAPATRHLNTKAIGFRSFTKLFNTFQNALENVGIYEVFPRNGPARKLCHHLCQFKASYPICIQLAKIIDGLNPDSLPYSMVKVIFAQEPAGTSVQNVARYGQALESEEFKKFDYGFIGNLNLYRTISPPIYNLTAVSIPTVVFYGNNDGIVDKEDVKWSLSKLGNVIDVVQIADPLWTHLDFIYSQFIPKYLFGKVNHYLNMFSY